MAEWRVTFPGLYPRGPKGSEPPPGHKDPMQRQGYYINAATKEEAESKLETRYPRAGKAEAVHWNHLDHPEKGVPIKGA